MIWSENWVDAGLGVELTPYMDWLNYRKQEIDVNYGKRSGAGNLVFTPVEELAGPRTDKGFPLPDATMIPLPGYALPDNTDDTSQDQTDRRPAPAIYAPPLDAVIVGIIDNAIALGHQRFCNSDGTTRILASWQQGAKSGAVPNQPFGRSFEQGDINALLQKHPGDEQGLNTALGIGYFDQVDADRTVEQRFSHGTHALDLAAGEVPGTAGAAPIIAVNMPYRPAIGAAGTYLEYLVLFAIEYIVAKADEIWDRAYAAGWDRDKDGATGYPIVLNLSYGVQAGPKDGTSLLQRFFQNLCVERAEAGKAPVRLVMPAGNENLLQLHAEIPAEELDTTALDWRILPGDKTSNYLEVWSELIPEKEDDGRCPFQLSLAPPGGDPHFLIAKNFAGTQSRRDLLTGTEHPLRLGSVYATRVSMQDGYVRYGFRICLGPTEPEFGPAVASGAWRLHLRTNGAPAANALVYVQSDQSLAPWSNSGRRSYLDHPNYERFDAQGRIKDTARFDPSDTTGALPEVSDDAPVRRTNTWNALASVATIISVGGYRRSDGRPAPYSSSGRGMPRAAGTDNLTVAFPSDDGYAHPGLLAAGAKSGGAAVMQGTSFATALATRQVIAMMAQWHQDKRDAGSELGNSAALAALAEVTTDPAVFVTQTHSLKTGNGRVWAQTTMSGRVARMG